MTGRKIVSRRKKKTKQEVTNREERGRNKYNTSRDKKTSKNKVKKISIWK